MAKVRQSTAVADDVAEEFLGGKFLQTMRLYAEMAGTENPAVIAAARLQSGQAAEVSGEWVGPEWAGLVLRLKVGAPVVVVATDD